MRMMELRNGRTLVARPHMRRKNSQRHAGAYLYGMVDYRLGWLSTYTPKLRAGRLPGEAIMRARQLIDTASFGPDALKVIGEAFDAAWAEIAARGRCCNGSRNI
jgi:hypothetical protein